MLPISFQMVENETVNFVNQNAISLDADATPNVKSATKGHSNWK